MHSFCEAGSGSWAGWRVVGRRKPRTKASRPASSRGILGMYRNEGKRRAEAVVAVPIPVER